MNPEAIRTEVRSEMRDGWRIIAVGFVLLLLMFGIRLSFGIYIKPMAEHLETTRASISGSQSLYMVTYALFALIAGSLADRFGPKGILASGALFMGAGMLLASRITALWQYYAAYGVLVAVGSGFLYVPVTGAVSKFFAKKRNFAIGIAVSGAGVGQYLIPPFVQRIVEAHGWHTALLYTSWLVLAAGVTMPLLLLRGRGLPEAEVGDSMTAEPKKPFPFHYTLGQALRTAPFWTYFGMYFIVCFVIAGIVFVHIYPYLTDMGFEGQTAAKALGYIGLISTVTMVAFAPLGDRFNKRLLLTGLLVVHTLMLLWLIHLRGRFGLWGFVFLYGVLLGMAWPLTVSILAETFGSRSMSAMLGACTLAFGLAGLIAPWLAGYVFDLYKSYHPVFYFSASLSAVCVVFTYYTRKTQKMIAKEGEAG